MMPNRVDEIDMATLYWEYVTYYDITTAQIASSTP